MVPSWFIPPVGIIVAAVTSRGMQFDDLAHGLFLLGFSCYLTELPLMVYRLIFRECIPDAALPTFAVMAAPASLSLAGYLTVTDKPELWLVLSLVCLGLAMTALVYLAFWRLLRLPFSPGMPLLPFRW